MSPSSLVSPQPNKSAWAPPVCGLDFIGVMVVFLALNVPWFPVMPEHDTLFAFQIFHYFYSAFSYTGELPQWLPYCTYGMDSILMGLVELSPAGWLALLVGAAAGLDDAVVVFNLGLLLEQVVLVAGCFLLARSVCQTRVAVWFLCLGAIASTALFAQIKFSFRIYYCFPLELYCLHLFFHRRQSRWFWLCGCVASAGMFGNAPYFGPIHLYVLAVACLAYSIGRWKTWQCLISPQRLDVALFATFMVIAGSYLYVAHAAVSHIIVLSAGRDPNSAGVGLTSFLEYGGHPSLRHLLDMFIGGWPLIGGASPSPDDVLYIGLLPWPFIIYSLVVVRHRTYIACTCVVLFLLSLANGGFAATAMYHLPLMPLFRHIGHLYPFAKIALLIMAAFGLDAYVQRARWHWSHGLTAVVVIVVVAQFVTANLSVVNVIRFMISQTVESVPTLLLSIRTLVYVLITLIATVLVFRSTKSPNTGSPALSRGRVAALLVLAYAVDMVLFHGTIHGFARGELPSHFEHPRSGPIRFDREQFGQTVAPTFTRQRRSGGWDSQDIQVAEYGLWQASERGDWRGGKVSVVYASALAQMQRDPCTTDWRFDIVNSSLAPLLMPIAAASAAAETQQTGRPSEQVLKLTSTGVRCGDKLRFATMPLYVDSIDTATKQVMTAGNDTVVLVNPAKSTSKPAAASTAAVGDIDVRSYSPNELHLHVSLRQPASAWLVYLDGYHPGWQATLNGQPIPVLRADASFKAITIPSGDHDVRFTFRAPHRIPPLNLAMSVGALCSIAGIIAVIRAAKSTAPNAEFSPPDTVETAPSSTSQL